MVKKKKEFFLSCLSYSQKNRSNQEFTYLLLYCKGVKTQEMLQLFHLILYKMNQTKTVYMIEIQKKGKKKKEFFLSCLSYSQKNRSNQEFTYLLLYCKGVKTQEMLQLFHLILYKMNQTKTVYMIEIQKNGKKKKKEFFLSCLSYSQKNRSNQEFTYLWYKYKNSLF